MSDETMERIETGLGLEPLPTSDSNNNNKPAGLTTQQRSIDSRPSTIYTKTDTEGKGNE